MLPIWLIGGGPHGSITALCGGVVYRHSEIRSQNDGESIGKAQNNIGLGYRLPYDPSKDGLEIAGR